MNSTLTGITIEPVLENEPSKADFSSLLDRYNLDYRESEYYWQVGQIVHNQGWIIHLTAIFSQLPKLLDLLIPELIPLKVPFKIIRDQEAASLLMDGKFGYIHLGKLISIYPHDDKNAAELAKKLIELTKEFKGPAIPTDFQLGGIVYTRYGSCNPMILEDQHGYMIKHIYNNQGQLVPDPYTIPFQLPSGISWPYFSIASNLKENRSKLLNGKYYPVKILKPDVKGNVIRALYFKRLWQIKLCLIKQGRQNMTVDKAGKDIRDKLKWQFELNRLLYGIIPMPKMFDIFIENEDCYLAMDYIKGISLHYWIQSLYASRTWSYISVHSITMLLDKLLTILDIVNNLHKQGFIHRDITPENFLIDKRGNIVLIDLELCWSINLEKPDPPFRLGTTGFMSPEQYRTQKPTIQEDIYALGALIIVFLTNLVPFKFDTQQSESLPKTLSSFIYDPEILELIKICLSANPTDRPPISLIQSRITNYKDQVTKQIGTSQKPVIDSDTLNTKVQNLIRSAMDALTSPTMITPQGYWVSKMRRREQHIGNNQTQLALYKGWYTGMAGPLWIIAKAKRLGYPINNSCQDAYYSAWDYIFDRNSDNAPTPLPGGLFIGKAGIAMAMSEGLYSELLEPNHQNLNNLRNCFLNDCSDLTLSNGISGQGIALLKSLPWLETSMVNNLFDSYIYSIISSQNKDGFYHCNPTHKEELSFALNTGQSGIILFLLTYFEKFEDPKVKHSIEKALSWLTHALVDNETLAFKSNILKRQTLSRWSIGAGTLGIILCLIKAYKTLQNSTYKAIAEANLALLPDHPVRLDFSLNTGISGLGEVLLEAHKVFKTQKWKEMSDWIAQTLISTAQNGQMGSGSWWVIDISDSNPTADLSNGTSGIIDFLLQHQNPHLLGHTFS